MPNFWPQFVIPHNQIRTYEVWDSYTGDVLDEFDTRAQANAFKRNMEQMGEWQTRIRTIITEK